MGVAGAAVAVTDGGGGRRHARVIPTASATLQSRFLQCTNLKFSQSCTRQAATSTAVASFCSHLMAPGEKPDFGVRTPITGRENPEIWVVFSRRAPTAPTSRDLATAAASAATASGRPLNPRRRRGRCCGAVAVPPRPRDAPPRDSSSAAMTGEQRHAKPPPTARRDGGDGLRLPCRRRWAVTL